MRSRPEPARTEEAPLVSIVIPVFNQARFLAQAIASTQAQTVGPAEVIVVDDGSTDDPGTVVAEFRAVRLIRQEKLGLAAARNTGWRAARGRHLVFLDADDRLLPRALAANLARFADAPGCALVYGGHQLIDVDGHPLAPPTANDLGPDPYEGLLRGNAIAMHATVMYRRDRVEEAGGFDEALPACEDYDLLLRLARHHGFGFHPEVVAEYRRHQNSMSEDLPLMLTTALRVLRRQQAHAAAHQERQAAFVAGARRWKEHYAREALWRLERAIRRRTLGLAGVFAFAHVFVRAPAPVLRVAAIEVGRRLGRRRQSPRPGTVDFGDLRRLEPIGTRLHAARGLPIDCRYVEEFLARNARDVHGRVLEFGDGSYAGRFGGQRVAQSGPRSSEGGPPTTLARVLVDDHSLPSEAFDCIILPNALHLAFDLRKAVATLHRALKPGGVLLATAPGVSGFDRGQREATWYWSFTPAALNRLLSESFGTEGVAVGGHGNVLAATAFLQGVTHETFEAAELERVDPDFPVVVTARAVKRAARGTSSR